MITTKKVLVLLALSFPLLSYADNFRDRDKTDSLQAIVPRISVKSLLVPGSLMLYGTIETLLAPKYRMLNYAIGHEVINHRPPKFTIDDVTQYLPAASVYVLNISGVKGKNSFKDRTIILGIASLFTAVSVNSLKYTTNVERPDKSAFNSFPSGHTAVAFMGAEFLRQEYQEVSPWIGIGGYLVAASTGALRIYNNKHWVGDIAFGAGVGILSAKLAYWLYPTIKNRLSDRKRRNNNSFDSFVFFPYYNGQQGGLSIVKQF